MHCVENYKNQYITEFLKKERKMETYKELNLNGKQEDFTRFKENLLKWSFDGWEISKTGMNGYEYIALNYSGEVVCKSTVYIYIPKSTETPISYKVVNIVPDRRERLSYKEYNEILMKCNNECIKPCADMYNILCEISGGEVELEDYMTKDAAKKLRVFSSLANKGTGSSHPSDQERWNDFICQVFTDKSENVQGILERWLIEEEKWHYEIASDLTIEFESGISLLEYYEEYYNGR